MALDPEAVERLTAEATEIIARYPQARSALLPMLHLVQSEEGEVTVTMPKSGTLTFYCKYHRARGMTGQLTSSTKPTSDTTTSSSDYG